MEELQNAGSDELLEVGIQAAKVGNKRTARVIFQQVLDQDKRNERALFCMAAVASTLKEKQRYLRAVLKVNPRNAQAQAYLRKLEEKSSTRDSQILKYGLIAAGVLVLLLVVAVIVVMVVF